MTILVDARPLIDPSWGGVPRVASGLLPALVAAMPETKFIFQTTGMTCARLPFAKGEHETTLFRHFRIPNKLWSLGCFLGIVSFDQLAKADLLFLPNIGFIGRPKIPYALVVHDLSFLIEPHWFLWKLRLWHHAVHAKRLIREARHLFAVSERTKQDLIDHLHIPAERVTVMPMGSSAVGTQRAVPLPEPLQNRRFVLAMGARDPRKNAGCAVAAVETLQKDPCFADVRLILLGRDLGRPSDEAVTTLMQHAAAFLYPSWYEGFGLPLHEAARFGTPCIASTAGALPETAPQGTRFAPPSKPHLWTEALREILDDPGSHRTQTDLGDWSAAAQTVRQGLEKALK